MTQDVEVRQADVEAPCGNCGEPGSGSFCASCGRRRVTSTPSLRELLREGATELLGVERRLLRTIWHLARRPGFLTQEYRQGNGAAYISPLRLLLLAGAVWAATGLWRDSIPLHFADIGVSYPTIALIAMPLFAAALFVGYYERGRTYAEYLVFALYFQAAQLLFAAGTTPIPARARGLMTVGFASYYLTYGARRLWGETGVGSWIRSLMGLLLYALSLLVTFVLMSLTIRRGL